MRDENGRFMKGNISLVKGKTLPMISERMKNNNPMKDSEIAKKMGKTRKTLIGEGKIKTPNRSGCKPWNKDIHGYRTSRKGMKHTEKTKEKIRMKTKGRIPHNKGVYGNHIHSELFKKTLSDRMLKNNPMNDPKIRDKALKNLLKVIHNKPNKKEILLNQILQEHFPNEWKYVGNGDFILGGKCPDFLNCNGKKQLIELFGDRFHSKEFCEKYNRKYEPPEERINFFRMFGFDCLIIWENELRNINATVEKIRCLNE